MKALFALISVITLGILAGCQPHPPRPDKMVDMVADRIQSSLSLNDEQKAKLQDLVAAAKGVLESRKQAADPLRDKMAALIAAPVLDVAQVRTLIYEHRDEFQTTLETAIDAVLPKLAAFHDALNEDQRKKVVEFIDKMDRGWRRP